MSPLLDIENRVVKEMFRRFFDHPHDKGELLARPSNFPDQPGIEPLRYGGDHVLQEITRQAEFREDEKFRPVVRGLLYRFSKDLNILVQQVAERGIDLSDTQFQFHNLSADCLPAAALLSRRLMPKRP